MKEWISQKLKRPTKIPKKEAAATAIDATFVAHKCMCCGDRFSADNRLREHYARVHPGVSVDWIITNNRKAGE